MRGLSCSLVFHVQSFCEAIVYAARGEIVRAKLIGLFLGVLVTGTAAAQPVEHFARVPQVGSLELTPNGHWLGAGCQASGRSAICLHRLVGEAETRVIPIPDRGELYGVSFPSNEHVVLTFGFLQTLNTIEGIRALELSYGQYRILQHFRS